MAKKGGVQQLQADISSDEEFDKFLEKTGLLVLDIYSEWCGPCLGMVGSLRKIKLELGGDNLQLAICKAGSITCLQRFNKKSEPTWMFVRNGRAIDIMFGTDVPKLVAFITRELQTTLPRQPLETYAIDELQPIELEQLHIRKKALEQAAQIEEQESNRKRIEYLKFVTDTIMQNLPDIGITVFGPQVNRDMFKKLSEPADPLKIQCKDRKVFTITATDFKTVNFASENPLEPDVIQQLYDKELLMCFWKVDEVVGAPPLVLQQYAHELTRQHIKPADEFSETETLLPPLISAMEVEIEIPAETAEEAAEEKQFKVISIPAIWVPTDQRTHAALIYTYFRAQTVNFLPPDPTPEPPHIIMVFDAYKKKDLITLVEACKEDVPLYGFFSSDNPQTATFIANSVEKYNAKTYMPSDKIVLKVNKVNTQTIPQLLEYGPSYVSANSVVGAKEASKFFPASYKSALQELAELHAVSVEKPKKRKKNKKAADLESSSKTDVAAPEKWLEIDEAAKISPEEGVSTTSSGEDSCESRPATADGSDPAEAAAEG